MTCIFILIYERKEWLLACGLQYLTWKWSLCTKLASPPHCCSLLRAFSWNGMLAHMPLFLWCDLVIHLQSTQRTHACSLNALPLLLSCLMEADALQPQYHMHEKFAIPALLPHVLPHGSWWIECVTWCSAQGKRHAFGGWGWYSWEAGGCRVESKGQRPGRFVYFNYQDLTKTQNSQETGFLSDFRLRPKHLLFRLS